jgi:anti-sigma factor RsiW
MNNCESIRESIGGWLDGELSPAQSDTVRAHVASCPDCGKTRRQMEKIQLTLGNILTAESSRVKFAPLWREVERRINEKRSWHRELIEWFQSVLTAPRVAWAVPAVIGLLLAVLSLDSYLPGWRPGSARNNFASVESIDAYGRNVALLRENETKTTVIWLYQDQEGENEAAEDTSKSGPAF